MPTKLTLTYYSDILCIWAHISQARVDEVAARFSDQVAINYRFCSVFGDTGHKVASGWADRGGYEGYSKHVLDAASGYEHVKLHPEIWQCNQPRSSAPAHLVLKAVQRLDSRYCENLVRALRSAFFERCLDIGSWPVLKDSLVSVHIDVAEVQAVIDSGAAHADLEADRRDQQSLMVQGSPTYILNEGRQKLYGNVGYGVIEANIRELLRSPAAGSASWC